MSKNSPDKPSSGLSFPKPKPEEIIPVIEPRKSLNSEITQAPPGLFSQGNFYDFSLDFKPTPGYQFNTFNSILKHTLGWGFLYLWGDDNLEESDLVYPQRLKVANYCYAKMNSDGERVKKRYMKMKY